MFKFRSSTTGLNEELGRHGGKNDDRQCKLCGDECESVVHALWECPAYDTIRNTFMEDLDNLLGGSFRDFSALNKFERRGFVLGCENWERYDFKAKLVRLVRSFILLIWDTRKRINYMAIRMVMERHLVALALVL